jgi:hypothetical protein
VGWELEKWWGSLPPVTSLRGRSPIGGPTRVVPQGAPARINQMTLAGRAATRERGALASTSPLAFLPTNSVQPTDDGGWK